ncbi:MAG: folylpolyglutamate synthase/dihydrofolate synthase family protein [Thermodesulfobacteriota bacterium]|nr:folylpolyglutamate synthase/dihydrofolate synthase family protein [Thermodesulfobacteriota bacterium]
MESYESTIKYLYDLQRFGIKFGLTNISRLLSLFLNPHNKFKSIHIAGTNGKGSVAAFIENIFRQAGFKTGLFTSPHLVDFTERIKVNGEEIDKNDVVKITEEIRRKINSSVQDTCPPRKSCNTNTSSHNLKEITYFEFVTAMAFIYFARENVDFAILETGMGGRLDATNVVMPEVSVITNISLEHQQYLGETLEEIAGEKAGIIKRTVPVVTGVTQDTIIKMYEAVAKENNASIYRLGKDFWGEIKDRGIFDYKGIYKKLNNLKIRLNGRHQIDNALLSLAVIELVGEVKDKISEDNIKNGLLFVSWPGRLEMVWQTPRVLVDGAHNVSSAEALSKCLLNEYKYNRLFLVLGIMIDKDIENILSYLMPIASKVFLTRPQMDRAAPLNELSRYIKKFKKEIRKIENVEDAIKAALKQADSNDIICITGSLFTVGEAIRYFNNKNLPANQV